MYTFLLVDDHSVIRTGLKLIIQNQYANALIDEAENGKVALQSVEMTNYNLVILDLNIPETDTANLISEFKVLRSDIKILLFTMNSENMFAKKYLKLGINGFLSKDGPNDEIIEAIENILKNGSYLSANLKKQLSIEVLDGIKETPFSNLSNREFEVAQLLIQGKKVTEISNILKLHTSSIATYKSKIFEKCQVENVLDLYQLAKLYNIL